MTNRTSSTRPGRLGSLRALGLAGLLAAGSAAAPASSANAADDGQSGTAARDGCFVELNYYYPKPGKQEEALATRLDGRSARAELGLPTGRILVLQSSASGHPVTGMETPGNAAYLMSLIEYESAAAAEEAHEALLGSQAYLDARARMAGLLEHFETASWHVAAGGCKPDGAP